MVDFNEILELDSLRVIRLQVKEEEPKIIKIIIIYDYDYYYVIL